MNYGTESYTKELKVISVLGLFLSLSAILVLITINYPDYYPPLLHFLIPYFFPLFILVGATLQTVRS